MKQLVTPREIFEVQTKALTSEEEGKDCPHSEVADYVNAKALKLITALKEAKEIINDDSTCVYNCRVENWNEKWSEEFPK